MKTDELKIMIQIIEDLGHKDVDLVLIEGRDGKQSFPQQKQRL